MIYIENKKRKLEKIQEQYPNADILDITSTASARYAQILSPFFPMVIYPYLSHQGIMQHALKVFGKVLKYLNHVV